MVSAERNIFVLGMIIDHAPTRTASDFNNAAEQTVNVVIHRHTHTHIYRYIRSARNIFHLLFIARSAALRHASRCVKFTEKSPIFRDTAFVRPFFCLSLRFFGCGLILAFQAISLWPIKGAGNRSPPRVPAQMKNLSVSYESSRDRASPQKYINGVLLSDREKNHGVARIGQDRYSTSIRIRIRTRTLPLETLSSLLR